MHGSSSEGRPCPCDSTRSVSRLFPPPTPDLYVINGKREWEIELEISNYGLLRNFLENGHCPAQIMANDPLPRGLQGFDREIGSIFNDLRPGVDDRLEGRVDRKGD